MAESENQTPNNIVTPVALAKELGIKPQLVFNWVRNNKVPSERCVCGHIYLLRDQLTDFLAARDERAAEKEARIAAELAGEEADEDESVAV